MTRKELIDKITNNRSFQDRESEFYDPYRVSRESLFDMSHDFYYLLLEVLNYLDNEDIQEEPVKELEEAAELYANNMTKSAGCGVEFTTEEIKNAVLFGANWQKEQMIKYTVERVKKKMITRAIAWVEWNNRNGSCLFDGWKESLREAMEGE